MSSEAAGVDFNEDPLGSLLNIGLQYGTYGTVGYGDGGFKKGIVTDLAVKGTKEITGAAAAEEANAMAKQQYEENKIKALEDRTNAQTAAKNTQIAASNAAGGARTNKTIGAPKADKVGGTKDFLGL